MAEDTTKIIRIVIDSSKAVDGGQAAQRALDAIEKQTGSMAQALDRMQQSIVNIGSVLKAHLALAATEAIGRLVEMAKQSFEAAAGMGELAEQIGLTARELQGLQFIGVQSGASIDDVTTAATKFSVKMGEAANGSKPVIDALKDLGVKNLDLQGNLRPTADLMAEVARKILAIEDPARRSAAMVDFFSKSGTKMSAVMADMAKGLGAASSDAEKFGAMISDDTIKKLDNLADALDRAKLKHRNYFAELLADAVDLGDKIDAYLQKQADALNKQLKPADDGSSWYDSLRDKIDQAGVLIARFNGSFVEAFRSLPDLLGKAIVDGLNVVLRKVASWLDLVNTAILDGLGWLGIGKGANAGNSVKAPQLDGGGADFGAYMRGVGAAGDKAAAQLREKQQAEFDARQQQQELRRQAGMQDADSAARRGSKDLPANLLTGLNSGGAGTSVPKDDGKEAQAQAEKLQKLKDTLDAAVTAQNAMTAAARQGDVAFQEQQAAAEATAKAIDYFGGKVSATDPKVKALAETLQKPIFEKMQGAAAQAFVVATTELQKQNDLLTAQIQLMNESPEIQARELAVIKAKQEAQKAGNALTAENIENRRAAIEQNETLKIQAEQLRKAEELWTAPLKQALENIQTAGADAFEQILTTGNLSFQSLAQTFTSVIRRMAAEFLALATIRPVMSVLVQAIGPGGLGLIGGNTATQLGFPQTGVAGSAGGGGLGSSLGGTGLGSLFGGGGSTSMLGSFGTWLNTPFAGGFSGVSNLPAGMSGPAANTAVGGLGGLGGGSAFTPLGTIGSLAGIGMGAYNLINGGGSTGSIIGGASGILGGGLGLASMLLPALAGTLGPIGIGVGLLGAILPSLFGDSGPKIPPMPPLQFSGGAFNGNGMGYSTETGNTLGGGSDLSSQMGSIGASLLKAFSAAGLTVNAGQLIGGGLGSSVNHVLKDGQWQDDPSTTTVLRLPGGGEQYLTDSDPTRDTQAASEYLMAQVFRANVLQGGVSGAGPGLKQGLDRINPQTSDDLNRVVSLGVAYDKLGETLDPAKDAIDKITASFADMKDFATEAGLSLDPINDALKKQSTRSAQDFIDAIVDPSAVQLRALEDERDAALKSAEYIKANFSDVTVDLDAITKHYVDAISAVKTAADALANQPLTDFTNSLQQQVESLVPTTRTAVDVLNDFNVNNMAAARALEETTGKIGAVAAATSAYNDLLKKTADNMSSQLTQQLQQATQSPLAAQIDTLDKARSSDLTMATYLSNQLGTLKDGTSALIDQVVDTYKGLFDATTKTFRDGVTEGIKAFTDPLGAQLDALHTQRDQAMADAATINDYAFKFGATMVNMASVTELYARQEAQVKQQYYEQTLGGLEDLVKRLTFGDLSGATALDTLSGVKGAYNAALAGVQANPLDQDRINAFVGAAGDLATEGKSYFAESPEYFALRQQITDALTSLDATVRSQAGAPGLGAPALGPQAANSIGPADVAALISSQQQIAQQQSDEMAAMRQDNAELTRQIRNLLARAS